MRSARIQLAAWLLFGGITACSDHNPTVVFTGDAGTDAKSEAGTPLDGGNRRDGGMEAEVGVVIDGGVPAVDVQAAIDLTPDTARIIDVANPLDVGVERALDLGASIDSASSAVDGAGGPTFDGGIDASAVLDGGKAGG